MIRLRIDVDYPYPSRLKGFVYTYLNYQTSSRYLYYAKMLADIINQSELEVKANWFFTKHTLPDNELLCLLSPSKHEIGLHVINDPYMELKQLSEVSPKPVNYYTIHGTERLLGQVVWHRRLGQKKVDVPSDFVLGSFHEHETYCLDWLCYNYSFEDGLKLVKDWVRKGAVLEVHPEWLEVRGVINHRGPYKKLLTYILSTSAS